MCERESGRERETEKEGARERERRWEQHVRCHGNATDDHQLAGVTVTGFLFLFHLTLEKTKKASHPRLV